MTPNATTVTASHVARRTDHTNVFLLDVRRESDYERWQIDGTHNIPLYDQLLEKDYTGLKASLDKIPQNKTIYIICVAGITSARAAAFLRARGYDATSMTDGMRGWGRVHQPYDLRNAEGVTQLVRVGTGCLSYLLSNDGEAIVVDPSLYTEEYIDTARERGVEIIGVVDTHAHADHVSGGPELASELVVPYYLHNDDSGHLTNYTPVQNRDSITIGDRALEVLHTPGHTPGSISPRFGDALLTGDTLFIRSVGRPDLEDDGDSAVRHAASRLFGSLQQLADMSDETLIMPGHFSSETVRPLARTLDHLLAENELMGVPDEEAFVDTIVGSLPETPANYRRIKNVNVGREPLCEETATLELGPNNCAAN